MSTNPSDCLGESLLWPQKARDQCKTLFSKTLFKIFNYWLYNSCSYPTVQGKHKKVIGFYIQSEIHKEFEIY